MQLWELAQQSTFSTPLCSLAWMCVLYIIISFIHRTVLINKMLQSPKPLYISDYGGLQRDFRAWWDPCFGRAFRLWQEYRCITHWEVLWCWKWRGKFSLFIQGDQEITIILWSLNNFFNKLLNLSMLHDAISNSLRCLELYQYDIRLTLFTYAIHSLHVLMHFWSVISIYQNTFKIKRYIISFSDFLNLI